MPRHAPLQAIRRHRTGWRVPGDPRVASVGWRARSVHPRRAQRVRAAPRLLRGRAVPRQRRRGPGAHRGGARVGGEPVGGGDFRVGDADGNRISFDQSTGILILSSSDFFLGSKANGKSFISSSAGGELEISSSFFHLSSSGHITGSKVLFDGGKIGGFTIGNTIISASTGDDIDGLILDSEAKVLTFHGEAGKDSFSPGTATRNNVRLAVGQVATGSYGIKGFNSSGDRVFEVSETRNEIGGFTINPNSLIGATSGTEKFRVELGTGDGLLIDDAVSFGLSLGGDASSDYDAATATSIPIVMAHDGSGGRTIFRIYV